MSDTNSFIAEVSEDLRRDRLYGYARKYGWIVALAIVAVVGGTALSEYRAATAQRAAQARGDAILAALDADDDAARTAALLALPLGEGDVVTGFLQSGVESDGAETRLRALTTGQPTHIADLARLKLALLPSLSDDERRLFCKPCRSPVAFTVARRWNFWACIICKPGGQRRLWSCIGRLCRMRRPRRAKCSAWPIF